MSLSTDTLERPAVAPVRGEIATLPASRRRSAPRLVPELGLQRTLRAAIGCVGVGLHGGRRVALAFRPAPVGTGIVFRRSDLGIEIPARFDHVVETRLSTTLGIGDARVGTVEHVMAALIGAGVDNAIVELDGPEAPILDGSAAAFLFLLDCAGTIEQPAMRRSVAVPRRIRVSDGAAFAELRPHSSGAAVIGGFDLAMSIDFDAPAIGRQALSLTFDAASFRSELADARTFTLAAEIDALRAAGLARGGSLDNAVVVDGGAVLNVGGFRRPDECVRHKLLDAVGDLGLAGVAIQGRFIGHRSGHALNNRLLHALEAALREAGTSLDAPAALASAWPMAAAAAPVH